MTGMLTARGARVQTICAGAGFVAPVLALAGLFGGGIMPPQPAHRSPEQLAAFYGHHQDLKLAGLLLATLAIACLGPLLAAITLQMLRMEGRHPAMTFLQVISGAVTWVLLTVPLLLVVLYLLGG